MWWLLKLLFVGPPSRRVEAATRSKLERSLEDLIDRVDRFEQKVATVTGNLLTQTRRITRLERDMFDVDEEAEDGDDFTKLLEEKRSNRRG